MMATTAENIVTGRRIRVRGLVQGVGFRPMVWRLARQHQLSGQVLNDGSGVLIELYGAPAAVDAFGLALRDNCPPLARIDSVEEEMTPVRSVSSFEIVPSHADAARTGVVADAATCPDCLDELFDPTDRRYRYPFINCTNCGPRLSIIDNIPYDRANTSMAVFEQCQSCQREYDDPTNRRFHAQPNACPECGPSVWLQATAETMLNNDAIERAQYSLKQDRILAIKGLGGFHLACDAGSDDSVLRLRQRKHRPDKPFALMARDIATIRHYCEVSDREQELLCSPMAPVVLLERRSDSPGLAQAVAPGQNTLGFMLPYTPLHHLLLHGIEQPLVMTSANVSHAPQLIDNQAALSELGEIADVFLLHDREIRHRVDDSVVRVVDDKPRILRRARGYAPQSRPLPAGFEACPDILAMGGELKNTFCLTKDGQAIVSQHIGDMENARTYIDYKKNLSLYQNLFEHRPESIVIDAHPEYLSSKLGSELSQTDALPLRQVQHHHTHIAACLADNHWGLNQGKVLGVVLDGLGFGDDGSLWGGEFLLADYRQYRRLACFKPVAMLGGSQAIQQPWRNTYAQLLAGLGWKTLTKQYAGLELLDYLQTKPLAAMNTMLQRQQNAPLTSSCGRLFDAVAAALGICREAISYEGQAAIELEAMVDHQTLHEEDESLAYPFAIRRRQDNQLLYIDPLSMWQALLDDLTADTARSVMAARFHRGLATVIVNMVQRLNKHQQSGLFDTVALSGGVMQNKVLFELLVSRLKALGFNVLSHQQLPSNDGGLSLGQACIAAAQSLYERRKSSCV